MTVTLTNAPPPSKDEKVASPRSGRQSKASPHATLPGLLLDQSCSPLLRALCVATLLSVLAVLAMTAERDETRRPERTARAARVRVAASPLTTLTQSAADDDTALDSDFSLDQAALTWSHRLGSDDAFDAPGVMRFGSVKVQQSIVERVVKAAQTTEMDPALLMAIADKESNFSSTAKARTSSASGLFQFVEKTWLKAMKTFGWRHGHGETAAVIASDDSARVSGQKRAQILGLRNDPYLSAVLAAEMLKKDSSRIAEKIGRPLTRGETYLIHFLGPDDAERFMRTMDEAPHTSAASLLPRPARANKPIFYEQQGRRLKVRSVQEVHEAFETMMDKRTSRYEDVAAKLPGGATAYAE
ncbi:transglycosylase SLT domain-containing protein [Methylocystis sp. H4A]|uniref:transglycosylase SLT domain-containing protein n=1 Tax=Methylocystis sp. H4A TaxID=2785788 RepID=UPI0018C24D72|nr:transglycosylase SLT domain-containing protein [Methylocystis sp. H4A]MBG0803547.1 transglycosylase SLT domain-containing protein [Methylocystis sp. H4A]